jgi:hypothetical protein
VVELCLQALAAGQCPVIGLQSTGEARTAAYVKAAQASKERGGHHAVLRPLRKPLCPCIDMYVHQS